MTDPDALAPIGEAFKAGDLATTERLCREHLASQPDEPGALLLLGVALQRQGHPKEAVGLYRRLTELSPRSSLHWGNYATALRVAGDPEAAERAAQRALDLAPDEPERLQQLGLLQLQLGKPLEARAMLLRAWSKSPDSPTVRIYAAKACEACNDIRVDMLLEPWRAWLPLEDDLQADLAELLSENGQMHPAIFVLEDLLQRVPTHLPARLLLARSYERTNRLEEADALLQEILASGATQNPRVARQVARQRAQLDVRAHRYGAARTALEQLGPGTDAGYGHYFALARVCDKLGDAPATMAALATGHARQVEEIRKYAAYLLEPGDPPLPHANDRLAADGYRAWPGLKAPDESQSPLFVVGFPRSGTTLLEQMLDAHPQLQSMDERPFFNELARQLGGVDVAVPRDLGRLDQRDCDELRKGYLILACGKVARNWATRLVDKNPLNMLWLPLIHRMYPHAKFILAVRHPCDVLLSCHLQQFRAAPLAVACQTLESLARAYVAAMQNWLYHVDLIHPQVFVSRYEDLVADPAAQTRRIADFAGLGDAQAMLHYAERAREKGFIATPSYDQVIKPVSAASVGHWQRYRAYFEPVLPVLAPMLAHWGYATGPVEAPPVA